MPARFSTGVLGASVPELFKQRAQSPSPENDASFCCSAVRAIRGRSTICGGGVERGPLPRRGLPEPQDGSDSCGGNNRQDAFSAGRFPAGSLASAPSQGRPNPYELPHPSAAACGRYGSYGLSRRRVRACADVRHVRRRPARPPCRRCAPGEIRTARTNGSRRDCGRSLPDRPASARRAESRPAPV